MTIDRSQVSYTAQDDSQAIVGLGAKVDDTYATDAALTASAATKATIASLAVYPIAGADNSVSHDYTATGVSASSTVFGALSFKTDGTAIAAVAGTITPGANKITVAGGADLSASYNIVFLVVK